MKVFIIISFLVLAASSTRSIDHQEEFRIFKLEYGKNYRNQREEVKRFNIFMDNLQSIEQHNARYKQGLVSYEKGVNEFSDMSREELRKSYYLSRSKENKLQKRPYIKSGLKVPESVDWRTKGQVTEVKSQKKCYAGWTFAIAGSVEAAYSGKSGNLVDLSEQQLLNCVTDYDSGCGGGLYEMGNLRDAFPYVLDNGLQSEKSYPYTASRDGCKYNSSEIVTEVSDYVVLGGEDDYLDAVANVGPIAASLDEWGMYSYKSGIYTCEYADYPTHGVLIVGYGSENGTDYWIVKNSWGPKWGENGYFRIRRNTSECYIDDEGLYPII